MDTAPPIANTTPPGRSLGARAIVAIGIGLALLAAGIVGISPAAEAAEGDAYVLGGGTPPAGSGPRLSVDLGTRSLTRTVTDPSTKVSTDHVIRFPHPISDGVYGMNFASNSVREELGVSVNRWGGNSTERFNHEVASTNIGNDWYFMNNPDDDRNADHTFENANQADGADTIITLPLLGWVAKDREASCGYPTVNVLGDANNAGPQDAEEPHWLNQSLQCGNGFLNGTRIGGSADPTSTSRRVDEAFAAKWVRELVATHGTAANGGVELYALGNEPGLWNSTHADVQPKPIGRTELIDRNQRWANAVKSVDPTAGVIGPVLWSGFSYYVTSEEFENGQRPGDVPTFVADYLDGMRDASDDAGHRLLDNLAINFYDDRVYQGGSDELRLESTRQLWDPTYAPSDWWVTRDFLYGDGSAVIPRMDSLINQHYPGTGLAITEYNFGGDDTLVGGLAQADALGIFGREGLDIATVWDPFSDWAGLTEAQYGARPIIDAFRLYRNYDGQGSTFGDISNFAQSSDESQVAVHAATRSADGAVTVLVINKSRNAMESPLTIDGISGHAERYNYSGSTNGGIVRAGTVDLTSGQTTVSLPGRSATLLVITDGDSTTPTPGPTPGPAPGPTPEVTVGPGTKLIDPPARASEGRAPLDSNDTVHVWSESGPTILTAPLGVNRTDDGSFTGAMNQRRHIPADTSVCSWYVFADRHDDNGRLAGSIDFTAIDVLGVITKSNDLALSTAISHPGTAYAHKGTEPADRFTMTTTGDTTTVTFDLLLEGGTDAARVVTACDG